MLKAGLLELGDIYVVNKYDLPQAVLFYNIVSSIIGGKSRVKPPIIKVSTLTGLGIKDLVEVIVKVREELISRDIIRRKRFKRRLACMKYAILSNLKSRISELIASIEGKYEEMKYQGVKLSELYNELLRIIHESLCSGLLD